MVERGDLLTDIFDLIDRKASGIRHFETISKQDSCKIAETEEQQDARERVVPCTHVEVIDRHCRETQS